ncbi:MAG: pyridoxamine 5'-phosphate oxidase family protein [Coprococcus sp.]
MTKKEMFDAMNQNPAFHLATVEENQPHVRGMLLYRADENGIIFHTASSKEVYKQMKANANVELCFQANGTQIRVKGVIEEIKDDDLKEEIMNHPSRKFLQAWKELGVDHLLSIFCLKHGKAKTWTMDTNFEKTEWQEL